MLFVSNHCLTYAALMRVHHDSTHTSAALLQAKTSIPGLGKPITAVDVTYDGAWVLATTDDYLMVVKASFSDEDGEGMRWFRDDWFGELQSLVTGCCCVGVWLIVESWVCQTHTLLDWCCCAFSLTAEGEGIRYFAESHC
jgi:hypothetical protein